MDRQRPDISSGEIDLYVRTYYSLLRSSGDVRVRSFEEVHAYSRSSLHVGARKAQPDISAFGYAAARLPACMIDVKRVVLGQSREQFEARGFAVRHWERVHARGRRRPMRYDGRGTLAVYIFSASDIDDLVPIVTAYQIEWNKLHALLSVAGLGKKLGAGSVRADDPIALAELSRLLDLPPEKLDKLQGALGETYCDAIARMAKIRLDLRMDLLASSFAQYQRAAQRWWSGVEPIYLARNEPERRPVYIVSSNTHCLANLLGGYALEHKEALLQTAQRENPDGILQELERALASGHEDEAANYLYFVLRQHVHAQPGAMKQVQAWDAASGIVTVPDPGHVQVSAQLIEIKELKPERFDPRIRMRDQKKLRDSSAMILNIDYPLGMAAYQLLSRMGQGVGALRGLFVMGKAATLNARVGDVMISNVAHDEHSKNTYVFRNAFSASDVAPYLRYGSVLDNQKVLTVRSAFLQNRNYMGLFYREGYTVMEMESGPFLSSVFELVDPRRHPNDEIVHLSDRVPFPMGFLHYASDTPYSRRQHLLSKSLSYFGMDSTYACASAIVRRIFELELDRHAKPTKAKKGR